MGEQRASPAIAGFFTNLTPLFAALLSAAFLGELPHLYHGLAFLLIVGGIVVSARRQAVGLNFHGFRPATETRARRMQAGAMRQAAASCFQSQGSGRP